jgi:hypothetical protein
MVRVRVRVRFRVDAINWVNIGVRVRDRKENYLNFIASLTHSKSIS